MVGRDGTREEVVKLYEMWLLQQTHLQLQLGELQGKDLICFCAPLPCHGDVLLKFANRSTKAGM